MHGQIPCGWSFAWCGIPSGIPSGSVRDDLCLMSLILSLGFPGPRGLPRPRLHCRRYYLPHGPGAGAAASPPCTSAAPML